MASKVLGVSCLAGEGIGGRASREKNSLDPDVVTLQGQDWWQMWECRICTNQPLRLRGSHQERVARRDSGKLVDRGYLGSEPPSLEFNVW